MVGAASATCGEVLTVGAPWGALRPHPRRVQRGIMPGVQLTRVGRLFSPRPRQRHAVSLLQCLNDFCGSTDYVTKSVFFHELGVSRGSAIERSGYHIYIYINIPMLVLRLICLKYFEERQDVAAA